MVSGQKKKRLNGLSLGSCDLQEQGDMKKKCKVDSLQNLLNMRAHISLELGDNQEAVVAKREQIGITWRELDPFINPLSLCDNDLADVFSVPQDIFGLKDLIEVLSCEVWETHLSETERNLLTKFLPDGLDRKQVVQALFTGENIHFGNPFLKWGASLCSEHFHPDTVLGREEHLKANMEGYRSELLKYHNDMVGIAQKCKEIWESSDDPEGNIVEKISRFPRKHADTLSSHANESIPCEVEENLTAGTESCSWVADEKVYSRNGSIDKRRKSCTTSEITKVATSSRKNEKPHKLYVRSDGAKYMSYFKITRRQHELVKEMKSSGNGIKSTSLNHILGDIKTFKVQPFEALEEEERKKLHEHWLQLANRDIPLAFVNWKGRHLLRQQWRSSLEQELLEKNDVLDEDKEKENLISPVEEERDNGKMYNEDAMSIQECDSDEESAPHSMTGCPLQQIPSLNGHHELVHMEEESDSSSQEIYKSHYDSPVLTKISEDRTSTEFVAEQNVHTHSAEGSVLHLRNSWPLQKIPSLNHHNGLNTMDVELGESSHDILKLKPNGSLSVIPDFTVTTSSTGNVLLEVPVPSVNDAWSEVGLSDPGYHVTPATHGYTSPNGLSLGQSLIFSRERPNHSIGLETDLLNQDGKGILLHKPPNTMGSGFHVDNGTPFFGSYQNQDRSLLLQQLLQAKGMVPSQSHDQKHIGAQLRGTSNMPLETGQHPENLHEQKLLMMQRLQMDRENYMHQQAPHSNMYAGGGRYSNPNQELFLPVNMQNWDFGPDHVSGTSQVQPIGRDFLGQNSFPVEHQARGVWSGMDISSSSGQCLGNGNNTDGNLYNVVSPFELQSHPYSSMGPSEQVASPNNFVSRAIGGAGNRDFYSHTGQELNYLGCEVMAPASLQANSISWMNLPHQNSSLHDSMGKPSLRSWNQ